MINKFLNNVNNGKNNWWRYLISIILTLLVSGIIAGFFLLLVIIVFFIYSGNFNINTINDLLLSYNSNIIFFFILTFFSISFSLIFLFISLKFIHKRDFMSLVNFSAKYDEFSRKAITLLKRIRWNLMLKGALIWLAFLLVSFLIGFIIDPGNYYLNLNINDLFLIILLFMLSIPIQVLFEELFFRGYINQALSLIIKKPIIIIIISSLLFSIGHVINGGMNPIFMVSNVLITFIGGIILSVATLATDGIEWAVGAHFANNLFAFLITSSEGSIGNFETIVQLTVQPDPFWDLIFSTAFLLVFAVILFFYKKEKIMKVFISK